MDQVECIVLGAGIAGLAAARALALRGHEVMILDAGPIIGSETSSRNSEVIHAGIYYPQGSLKALACVAGKQRLYRFCAERGVPHRRCEKLIVATGDNEEDRLKAIQAKAAANGVADLRLLSRAEAQALEPELACSAALLSPSTGIVDSHAFMLALQGEAEAHGAMTILNTRVSGGELTEEGVVLTLADGEQIGARLLVNALGLHAPDFARGLGGPFAKTAPKAWYAKGSYFSLNAKAPFSRLVYPLPEPGGLGVHITIDLNGRARFGPDVEWVDTLDYAVDPARADAFYDRIRDYWPGLSEGALLPDYSGIRPKISGPDEPAADFRIDGPEIHGVAGVVHMFGIESPGLTSSMDLADRVADRISPHPAPAGTF
ncbi:NAD(P)/FAD-dependent oxidoreductase [Hyphobacterium marinum]|uniref:NAD(P)/FAD-dependent oxidoreductase n=1 Tax=Hyphobacterium marinum TaxID=3116574 RepID=A0ABU7LYB9_9PROT|nr:NAD(P)/FAD-dependent oxidoreductase [Hyphobacterium sp. Y6023]MEE2566446.1 NAD(P)/FAD-dependent oxidoreductase [Hyphobacterium sp. Y6023]